jgi:hypothetical protein
MSLAAAAQSAPHIAVRREVELVYERPDDLAAIAARRTAAQRNLGRLAALTLAPAGLVIAAIAAAGPAPGGAALPPERAAAACVAALPGLLVWAWPAAVAPDDVVRDLGELAARVAEARAAVALAPPGRVLCPPFAGDVGAELESVEVAPVLARAIALAPGALWIDPALGWPVEADERARAAAFVPAR